MLNACACAEGRKITFTPEDVRSKWQAPFFASHLQTDAWVVLAPDGQIVGYADVEWRSQGRFGAVAYVHPDHTGKGIGRHLVRLIEARARQRIPEEPPDVRVTLTNFINHANTAACNLLGQEGYRPEQYDWIMEIELKEAPQPPAWPEGIALRAFVAGQDDRAVHNAWEEAFADHRGHIPIPFEEWYQRMQQRENFDPSLWFLAMDGAEIAGIALCSAQAGRADVEDLAVRRPWRRKGLGIALLRHAFGECYRRGLQTVALGVDAESLTGATRLYERAGMHILWQYDRYRKELRPGIDRSVQALVG
jgi:mycothiol synthase